MHQFFRERISEAFFVHRSSATTVGPIDYRQPLRFSEAGPGPGDGPRLVACAVANVTDSDLIPSKRGCTPFVFDDVQMGLTERMLPSRYARRASATYEFAADQNYRDATIPAAELTQMSAAKPPRPLRAGRTCASRPTASSSRWATRGWGCGSRIPCGWQRSAWCRDYSPSGGTRRRGWPGMPSRRRTGPTSPRRRRPLTRAPTATN